MDFTVTKLTPEIGAEIHARQFPLSGAQMAFGLRNATRRHDDEGHTEVRNVVGQYVRRVSDYYPSVLRRDHISRIVANAEGRYDLEVLQPIEYKTQRIKILYFCFNVR